MPLSPSSHAPRTIPSTIPPRAHLFSTLYIHGGNMRSPHPNSARPPPSPPPNCIHRNGDAGSRDLTSGLGHGSEANGFIGGPDGASRKGWRDGEV
ncbi:hypothetical protein Hypma_001536 [Hypsizygus marmoreus]|uniref:Uncharacterized protein n=1 Tax=Hypsizygus marmoreus TaxID=39966 RepID=A0A369K3L6_HYPMA|nr:hypothetical protein Hypma_001536 [Hypsizygus marmoreus]